MNLWFRLIWLFLTAARRTRIEHPTDNVDLSFRVLPTDLDFSLHMNNGRYLTIMDLGRLAFLFQSALWDVVKTRKLTPMVVAITIRYRREIKPFQRYHLRTRIIGWREATVLFEQAFVFADGPRADQVAARALVRAGLYNRAKKRWETVQDLMDASGVENSESPILPADAEAFLAAEREMQALDRGAMMAAADE